MLCQDEGLDTTFVVAVAILLLWSFLVTTVYCTCLKAVLQGAPALEAQFFAVTGTIQFSAVIAVLAFFVVPLNKTRNQQCNDQDEGNNVRKCILLSVLIAEALIAISWLRVAWKRRILAIHLSREHGGSGDDNGIFTKVPGAEAEMELTENSATESSSEGIV